jgi:hypothetical protein
MIAWLEILVRWAAGLLMTAFFGVFLFSIWITLTNRYRTNGKSPEPPPER